MHMDRLMETLKTHLHPSFHLVPGAVSDMSDMGNHSGWHLVRGGLPLDLFILSIPPTTTEPVDPNVSGA